MKLWNLIKSCFIAVPCAVTIFFSASEASADQAKLQACVQKCTEQMLICITGQEANLAIVCKGIAECQGVDDADAKLFNDVCSLCIKGVTDNCPGPSQQTVQPPSPKPPKTSPPASVQPPVPASPPPQTFEGACKAKGGVPVVEEDPQTKKPVQLCFTLQGAHGRIVRNEATLNILWKKVEDLEKNGQSVPPEVKTQTQVVTGETAELLTKLEAIQGGLSKYEEAVHGLVKNVNAHLEALLAKEVKRLDAKDAEHDRRLKLHARSIATLQDTVTKLPSSALYPAAAPAASVKNALMGLYAGPYYGRQAYNQYGVGLHAVGLELGLLPSLSESGKWRLEINGGGGYGGRNRAEANGIRGVQNLWEMHAHLGPRYTWGSGFALTGGMGMNRRASFSHDDVAMTWIGAFAQPSYTLTGSSGHGIYILGRLGVGNTHYQHLIVDKTGNKLDLEFNVGLGYSFMP